MGHHAPGMKKGRSKCLGPSYVSGGRYWDRTSGLFRVRETRSRCAKRPWESSLTEWRIIASMNFASFSCTLLQVPLEYRSARGSGSVGRAQPCQGWGRGFEPRLPLHAKSRAGFPVGSFTQMATWPSGKAGACKALTTGSNPVVASSKRKGPGNPGPCFFGGPTRIRTWNLSIMSRSR